jgi:P-type E1-E2 ATPase
MVSVSIPGWGEISIEYLVVDFNGTAGYDGKLKKGIKEAFERISRYLKVFVISADSYNNIDEELATASFTVVKVGKVSSGKEKAKVVKELGPEKVAAIGNGANDAEMLREAALGIGVIGEEGCATSLLKEADLVVTDISHALGLFVHPERIMATLRE